MRDIRFRAWFNGDKDNPKGMYEVITISFDSITIGSLFARLGKDTKLEIPEYQLCVPKNAVNIMQYIGLKDKNGKDIYEGDILSIDTDNGGDGIIEEHIVDNATGEVKWSNELCCFGVEDKEYGFYQITNFENNILEVIDNIYENPELLERLDK